MDGTEYIFTSGLIIIIIGLYSTAGGNNKPVRDDPSPPCECEYSGGEKRENKKKKEAVSIGQHENRCGETCPTYFLLPSSDSAVNASVD